jgi:hypothetical protein
MCDVIKQTIDGMVQQPAVQQCAAKALSDMRLGTGLTFALLKGGRSAPPAACPPRERTARSCSDAATQPLPGWG